MEELFEKGKELEYRLGMAKTYVQNEEMKYEKSTVERFDLEAKNIIKEIGVWKADVILFMEENE